VFTARYALSPYIKQIRFVFKGLINDEAIRLNILSVCLYSCLGYPAGKSHPVYTALYCYPWPVWLYNIFTHYLNTWHDFWGKKTVEHVFFIFYGNLSQAFRILRLIQRDVINLHTSSRKAPAILVRF
jgi:hypothetical protein